jgi:hypothetical protein
MIPEIPVPVTATCVTAEVPPTFTSLVLDIPSTDANADIAVAAKLEPSLPPSAEYGDEVGVGATYE